MMNLDQFIAKPVFVADIDKVNEMLEKLIAHLYDKNEKLESKLDEFHDKYKMVLEHVVYIHHNALRIPDVDKDEFILNIAYFEFVCFLDKQSKTWILQVYALNPRRLVYMDKISDGFLIAILSKYKQKLDEYRDKRKVLLNNIEDQHSLESLINEWTVLLETLKMMSSSLENTIDEMQNTDNQDDNQNDDYDEEDPDEILP